MSGKARYVAAALGASASWGLGVSLIKLLSTVYSVNQQNLVRYLFASAFLAVVYASYNGGHPYTVERAKRSLVPALTVFLFQLLATTGVYLTKAGLAAFMLRLNVVFLAVIVYIFFEDEKGIVRDPLFSLALTLGLTGVYGLSVGAGKGGLGLDMGVLLVGVASLFWAVYTALVKFFVRDEDPLAFSASVFAIASLMFVPLAGFETAARGFPLEPESVLILVASGAISIGLGNWLNIVSIKGIGAVAPSMIQMSTPFFTVLFSYMIFGETLTISEVLFGLLIVASSALALRLVLRGVGS